MDLLKWNENRKRNYLAFCCYFGFVFPSLSKHMKRKRLYIKPRGKWGKWMGRATIRGKTNERNKKSQRDRHQNKGFTLFAIALRWLCVSNVRWSTLSLCYGRCICSRLNIFPHRYVHSLSSSGPLTIAVQRRYVSTGDLKGFAPRMSLFSLQSPNGNEWVCGGRVPAEVVNDERKAVNVLWLYLFSNLTTI